MLGRRREEEHIHAAALVSDRTYYCPLQPATCLDLSSTLLLVSDRALTLYKYFYKYF